MKGIQPEVEEVLKKVSELDAFSPYILIGGTSLSLQIGHRLSKDLDFCIWGDKSHFKPDLIIHQLQKAYGKDNVQVLLDEDLQKDILVNGVKLTVFVDFLSGPPEFIEKKFYGCFQMADVYSIAGIKATLGISRSKFRDYYDLFCIAYKHLSVRDIFSSALAIKPHLNSRIIAQNITGLSSTPDENLSLLKPIYQVSRAYIQTFFMELLSPAGLNIKLPDLENYFKVKIIEDNVSYHNSRS